MKPNVLKAYSMGQATRLVVLDSLTTSKTGPAVVAETGLGRCTVQDHIAKLLSDGFIREAGKKTEKRLVTYSTMTYERTNAPISASGQAAQRLSSCFFGVSQ